MGLGWGLTLLPAPSSVPEREDKKNWVSQTTALRIQPERPDFMLHLVWLKLVNWAPLKNVKTSAHIMWQHKASTKALNLLLLTQYRTAAICSGISNISTFSLRSNALFGVTNVVPDLDRVAKRRPGGERKIN